MTSDYQWRLMGLMGPMGTKNHGDWGKIVDVIHHLSPKVPIIFQLLALDVEMSLKYCAR